MKQLINILIGCIFLLGMSSCEKDLPVYETPDCWLNFVYYSSFDGSVLGTEEVTDEMRYASVKREPKFRLLSKETLL